MLDFHFLLVAILIADIVIEQKLEPERNLELWKILEVRH